MKVSFHHKANRRMMEIGPLSPGPRPSASPSETFPPRGGKGSRPEVGRTLHSHVLAITSAAYSWGCSVLWTPRGMKIVVEWPRAIAVFVGAHCMRPPCCPYTQRSAYDEQGG